MADDFPELARTLKSITWPEQGFALLMKLGGQYHYAASADRADVRATLTEWLDRARAKVNTRDPGESPDRFIARAKLEAKCAELGHLLEAEGHRVVFFLFDFGDKGHLAWFTNAPDPLEVVERFLAVTA